MIREIRHIVKCYSDKNCQHFYFKIRVLCVYVNVCNYLHSRKVILKLYDVLCQHDKMCSSNFFLKKTPDMFQYELRTS